MKGKFYMIYEVWQLPLSNKNCFRGSDLFELNPVKLFDYVHVYRGEIDSDSLESIFQLLNVNHPNDYHARSLSVSDIICVVKDNCREWYYVDDFGFKKLNEKDIT